MALDAQLKWLIFEGALPLFGAGALYLVWGLLVAIARGAWSPPFAWREAVDPMGWLYGALIIVIQATAKSFAAQPERTLLAWACMIGAGFCFMLLLAAMNARGQDTKWQPRLPLKLFAALVVIGALVGGYLAHQPLGVIAGAEVRNEFAKSR